MTSGNISLIDGHIDEPIKCPCGLREHMEPEDCDKMNCDQCCPLEQEGDVE